MWPELLCLSRAEKAYLEWAKGNDRGNINDCIRQRNTARHMSTHCERMTTSLMLCRSHIGANLHARSAAISSSSAHIAAHIRSPCSQSHARMASLL